MQSLNELSNNEAGHQSQRVEQHPWSLEAHARLHRDAVHSSKIMSTDVDPVSQCLPIAHIGSKDPIAPFTEYSSVGHRHQRPSVHCSETGVMQFLLRQRTENSGSRKPCSASIECGTAVTITMSWSPMDSNTSSVSSTY